MTAENVSNVKYSNDGTDNLAKNFGTNNDGKTADGKYYMGCWLPVQPEYLEAALANGSNLQWTYKFDWNGDGTADQTFIATVDPANITLKKSSKVYCKTGNGDDCFAKVGNIYYGALSDAIDMAANGGTVTLLKDSTALVSVEVGETVTLDLNGHSITRSSYAIKNIGTLTIRDSVGGGTVKSKNSFAVSVGSNSVTTIESGNYESVEGAVITGTSTGATINITGGVFTASDNAVIAGNGTDRTGDGNVINISGGTFNGSIKTTGYIACGIYAPWNDTINVSGGTFNITGGAGIVARAGNVTVTGGEFNVTGNSTGWVGDNKNVLPSSAIVFDQQANYPGMTDDSEVSISGGTFTSDVQAISVLPDESVSRVEVSGGNYSNSVEEYVIDALNYELIKPSGEAPYSYYKTLDEAVAAADSKDEINAINENAAEDAKDVSVTFAYGYNDEYRELVVKSGTSIDLPSPTRENYEFSGWYVDGEAVAGPYIVPDDAESIILIAQWVYNGPTVDTGAYALRFETNGGSAIDTFNVKAGQTVDLSAYVPTKAGYDFAGWYLDKALTQAVTEVKMDDHTTVYAAWTEDGSAPKFVDVPADAYYAAAVDWAVASGITTGVTETTFEPNTACTRAQMVTFLWRAAGQPEPEATESPFVDVAPDAYYAKAVLWGAENGIVKGTSETTFSPEKTVNRGQAVTFLYRYAGEPAVSGEMPFGDVAENAYYYDAVLWAVQNGVTTGRSATVFDPNGDCVRAEIVTFLFRSAK